MSNLIEDTLRDLVDASCLEVDDGFYLNPTAYGRIASYYYLHHSTIRTLTSRLGPRYRHPRASQSDIGDFPNLLHILADVAEYNELPVRHNEDQMNRDLEKAVPLPINSSKPGTFGIGPHNEGRMYEFDDSHAKAFLLLQAHMTRIRSLPCADFHTDTISVLDQSIRVMQAMVDVAAEDGHLSTCLGIMQMMQCIKQASWPTDPDLLTLPKVTKEILQNLDHCGRTIQTLAQVIILGDREIDQIFAEVGLSPSDRLEIRKVLSRMPLLEVRARIEGSTEKLPGLWAVESGTEYEVRVDILRKSRHRNESKEKEYRVHAPKFPKPQYEGWWVVLGDTAEDEAIAIKRLASGSNVGSAGKESRTTSRLRFVAPDEPGEVELALFVVSDGYRGVDQTTKMRLLVK